MGFSRKIFIFFLIAIAVLIVCFLSPIQIRFKLLPNSRKEGLKQAYVTIHNPIWVKIAKTSEEREKGLSGVTSLAENEGMLFIYPQKGIYKFWMKEMNFPLDFLWIADGKIVDITENIPAPPANSPNNKIATCQPNKPVDMVLEVNAGWVKKNKIKIGDGFYLKD